ncbi:dihydrolipoyllysine-residue acetyltransferase [Porticoccaceae bacterium]|nr:dihydrolipoyllysine-residue acetyltransferase [Porticoccaceae bacterium]
MAVEIVTVPDLGGAESVDVIELNLTPGDAVELEDSLIVLESDKASMDVPSPFAGSLVKYLVADGATVKVGDAIAEIETGAAEQPAQEEAPVEETPVEEEEPQLNKEPQSNKELQPNKEPQPAEQAPAAKAPAVESEQLIVVPDIGSDDEVDLIEISIAIGDQVEEGDTLVVLESDKATMDVPSSHSGKVIKILAAEGDKLRTGSQVAILQVSNAEGEVTAFPVEAAPVAAAAKSPSVAPAAAPAPVKAPTAISAPAATEDGASADVYAGPSVRMLARELGVSLEKVSGTGPRGRIQKNDVDSFVKNALNNPASAATGSGIPEVPAVDFSQFGEIESIKLTKIQKLTGSNMQRNWLNVPHVTQFDDADITELEDFRKSLKAEGEKRGIRVTPVAFLIKAIAASLHANPEFNRSLAGDGEHVIQKHYINVGMAVDTPRGLMVPVIKDANEKGIWEISEDIMSLAGLARDGKLKPSDMQGGCFTLSSLGAIGGTGFTPIVNAPEVGILGVSKSQMKPVWNGSEFAPRLTLPLCLSYDHRVINGGDAGRFMTHLVKLLSDIRYLAL